MTKTITVLLLNPPFPTTIIRDNYCCFTSKSSYLWPPVDLLYLSSVFTHKSIKVVCVDAVAQKLSAKAALKQSISSNPDYIFSLTGTASFPKDLRFLKKLVDRTGSKLFLLGNTPCFKPKYFLKNYSFITGIVHNFLDPALINLVLNKSPIPESVSQRLPNGTYQLGLVNPPQISKSKLPPPQYNLFSLSKYRTPIARRYPMATALTTFGCPYRCKFCIASALNYFERDIESLTSEFKSLREHGVKEIFFEDSSFNANPASVKKICEVLISGGFNFSWSANLHSINITKELLALMKRAGCHTVQIGVESGNQETLNRYAPTKKVDIIKKSFQLCRQVGIKSLGYFIIGFPGETTQTSLNTIDLACYLNPDFASFSVLTPDYGTALNQEFPKYRLVKKFDSSNHPVITTNELSVKDQEELIKKAYIRFYLRPKKIISMLFDLPMLPNYVSNGLALIKNKILNQ